MLPTYCPSCRTIRQPNGTFCHVCGYSFLTKAPVETSGSLPGPPSSELSIGDGFRFGIGFMVAVVIFGLAFSVLSTLVMGTILRAMLGAFGQ